MIVVDAQIHLWATDRPDRPWPGNRSHPHRPGSFLTEDALKEMDAAGVARAVIVPPSWEGDRNDLALDAARTHPDRFAIMGRFAIERPEDRAVLDGWRRQPGMLGLRFTFGSASQRGWLTDGTADWFWPVAEPLALPVMLSVPGSLPHVDRIAERHPALRIIIDHMGTPQNTRGAEAFAHLPQLLSMARHANVAVKASALPSYSAGPIHTATCTTRSIECSTRSARGGCSGARTSRGSRARIARQSRSSPRSCRGSARAIRSS